MNACYTYFLIRGDFDPDEITRILELEPDNTFRKGDLREDGISRYEISSWSYGRCDHYMVETEKQVHITIDKLIPKIQILNEIRDTFDVCFSIEVVPEIYAGETTPTLGPDTEIVKFCYLTNTEYDIDLYVGEA